VHPRARQRFEFVNFRAPLVGSGVQRLVETLEQAPHLAAGSLLALKAARLRALLAGLTDTRLGPAFSAGAVAAAIVDQEAPGSPAALPTR